MRKPKKLPWDITYEPLEQYAYTGGEILYSKYDAYVRAIGQFFIAFSRLETEIEIFIADTMHDDAHDPGFRIIKYLKYKDKCSFLGDEMRLRINIIARQKSKPRFIERLKQVSSELDAMGEFRNKVAHANWMTLDASGFIRIKIQSSEEGYVEFRKLKMTPAVMQKFTRRCRSLARELEKFKDDLIWSR